MKKKILLFAISLPLAIATVSSAANKAETFSISPMVGGITFEGKQHLDTNPVYGLRFGYNFTKEFGVEALFDYAGTEPTLTGGTVDFYRYGGEMLYHFFPDNTFVPYVAAGYAAVDFNGSVPLRSSGFTSGAFDYGFGAKYSLTDAIALRGDVRHLVYRFNGTQQAVEYMAGLYIPFGGVKPVAKPVEPVAPVAAPVAKAPVPEPVVAPAPVPAAAPIISPVPVPIPVVVVAAPPKPSASLTVTPTSITKGESAALSWTSQNASTCEIQPAIGSVQLQGTMNIAPADSTTYTLTCEGAVSAAKVAVAVPPPVVKAAKLCSPTVINIQFDTNKSDIKPKYHDELKKLNDFLTEFPNAKGVIEGYTDNVGTKASNVELSQRRADSVCNYMIKNFGLASDRIQAKGYGPAKPIAGNDTKEGKAQNRRIEANFICE